MNDRCAAGTGKFLEIMVATLGFDLNTFGAQALAAQKDLLISRMCMVFAESEVTSPDCRGEDRREISRGLHTSVIRRAAGMINRVSSDGPIVFIGGVAKNPCMVEWLSDKLDRELRIISDPQLAGYSVALLAAEQGSSNAVTAWSDSGRSQLPGGSVG